MEGMYGRASKAESGRPDEATLLAGLRAGDADSFENLVRTWCNQMLAVARRIVGNEEDAKDCVQEAFLNAFRNVTNFEGRSALGTWLHRIVVNCALMKVRSRVHCPQELLDDVLPQFDATGHRVGRLTHFPSPVEELAERAEVRELVQRSIALLPDLYRVVLVLRDIEGYDTVEAAQLLDVSEAALKVRLHRARLALKKLIEPLLRGEST